MKQSRIILIILFLQLLFSSVYGKYSGKLNGIIIDSETNKPIVSAVIQIIETKQITTSDDKGFFFFSSVIEGDYTLKTTHVAYKESLVKIKFSELSQSNFIVYLIPKVIEISTIIVSDQRNVSKFDDIYEISNVLKGKQLQRDLGQTLAATLKNETGLAIRSMGPAPARPVIRGLGGDRVHISEDGIKTSDLSATSPDHAVTLEPFSVERIEVLRGPRVLLNTPVSFGGVVNVVKNEIPLVIHQGVVGTIGGYAETVNKGYLGSIITEIPLAPFVSRVEFSRRKSQNINTPVGTLKNSYSENINYSLSGSYVPKFGVFGASYRKFELDYGIPGGFVGAHPNGVDISLYKNQLNMLAEIKIENDFLNKINFNYSHSYYRHKEFEKSGKIGSEFRIINDIASIRIHHNKLSFFNSGIYGLTLENRDFDIGGFVFTSPAKSFHFSTYIFEEFSLGKWNFETALRYNFDRITPNIEKPTAYIGHIREREFNTYSASVSMLYQLSDVVYIGTNISGSSRVPTIEELFSEGPHLAAYSYEIGNPNLKEETGLGTEFFVYHRFDNLFFHINFFRNEIRNYIIPRNNGEINYSTFLPVYQTTGVDALLHGIEGQIEWSIFKNLSFEATLTFTRGKFKESTLPLPQIPPVKGLIGVKYSSDKFIFGINNEYAFRQNYVDIFEEVTAGYSIMNLFTQYDFSTDHLIHTLSLSIDNVFNKEYRNHLSRIKSILPEAGINLRLTYKMYFHF